MIKKTSKKNEKAKELEVFDEAGFKMNKNDEPSLYHYVIVLVVMFGVFAGVYFGFNHFYKEDKNFVSNGNQKYNYPYVVGNNTFNIKFDFPIRILEANNFTIEPNQLDVLNTIYFTRVFGKYNGSDNGEVAVSAIKPTNLLKYAFKISFLDNQNTTSFSCANSTFQSKIMTFEINSDKNGVFYNKTNGCIEFKTTSVDNIRLLSDKFIYEMVREKN